MKEIYAGKLDKFISDNNIKAIKTWEGETWADDKTQVWEVDDETLDLMQKFDADDWDSKEWGWWRCADGSNIMSCFCSRFNINGHYLRAFDNESRYESDNDMCHRKYDHLLEYLCEELQCSTERNVCAVAMDLAKINNMKLSELFNKYQPREME